MAARKNVSASVVRDWAASPEGTAALTEASAKFPGSRGRLDPSTIAVFRKENPRKTYETGVAEVPVRTFKHRALDKNGRTRWATESLTLAEARAVIGDTSKARLNVDKVVAALEARAGFVAPVVAEVEKTNTAVDKD